MIVTLYKRVNARRRGREPSIRTHQTKQKRARVHGTRTPPLCNFLSISLQYNASQKKRHNPEAKRATSRCFPPEFKDGQQWREQTPEEKRMWYKGDPLCGTEECVTCTIKGTCVCVRFTCMKTSFSTALPSQSAIRLYQEEERRNQLQSPLFDVLA